ncbi:Binding-protein-dependent transport systems inner membrane component [Thiomonas sp. X19]|uniref:ABC transporter permease n=1 Tax=Thiomonas sp. X19 TaxID=1050370 RepID=UPI000B67FDFA|nr:ABC transporter permease subunit [Thiomonas sp. X19]SCC92000.1 Binding-protein-dependent transport systems inner membrane component [Thiomonas sp. X19]
MTARNPDLRWLAEPALASTHAPSGTRTAGRRWGLRVGLLLATVAFAALWAYPLLGFLFTAFLPHVLQGDLRPTLAPLRHAFQGYELHALFNSLWVALTVGVLSLPFGLWLAWLRERTDLRGRGWIEAGVWLLLIFPDFFLASGWMLLAAPIGPLAAWPTALHAAQLLLGPVGIILTLALKVVPYVFLVAQGSLRNSSAALQEAARVHGLSRLWRLRLGLAALLPALAAGFAMAYAESLRNFAVVATLGASSGFTMGTYAIYQAVNGMPLNFPLAAATSWLLLALVLPALVLQSRVGRRARQHQTLGAKHRPAARVRLQTSHQLLHGALLLALALFALALPTFAALGVAWPKAGWAQIAASLPPLLAAIRYSLQLAWVAASITVFIALPMAWLTARPGRLGRVLDVALLAMMALPLIVLAAAYLQAYNQPYAPLYGGSLLLGMAYVALAVPATSRVLLGPVAQLHRSLADAARVHGLSRLQTLRHVHLPLLAGSLFYGWLLAVLSIAFELPASELLYPAGHPPLAVALLQYAGGFQLHQQARLQVLGMAVLLAFALLARWAYQRLTPVAWRQLGTP